MPETPMDRRAELIGRPFMDIDALIIRSAIGERLTHLAEQFFLNGSVTKVDYSAYAAHKKWASITRAIKKITIGLDALLLTCFAD